MARPIRETPILFGEDGRRFETRMKSVKPRMSVEEYEDMKRSYEAVLHCLTEGEKNASLRMAVI